MTDAKFRMLLRDLVAKKSELKKTLVKLDEAKLAIDHNNYDPNHKEKERHCTELNEKVDGLRGEVSALSTQIDRERPNAILNLRNLQMSAEKLANKANSLSQQASNMVAKAQAELATAKTYASEAEDKANKNRIDADLISKQAQAKSSDANELEALLNG